MAFDVKEVLDAKTPFQKTFGEDYDVRKGVDMDNIRGTARQVYGGPIEYDQDKLFDLERRASRLAPLNNVQAGSGAIPGNPYSIDTRGLMTGVSNLAVGAINRERNRRVMGDPKAVDKFTNRADARIDESDARIADGDTGFKTRRLQRGAARDLARAERYGGFGRELQSLRTKQQQELDRQTKEQTFIEKEAGNEMEANRKREETMTKGTIDMIRDIKRDDARMAEIGVQGQNTLNAIEKRFEKEQELLKWEEENIVQSSSMSASVLTGIMRSFSDPSLDLQESNLIKLLGETSSFQTAEREKIQADLDKIREQRLQNKNDMYDFLVNSGTVTEEQISRGRGRAREVYKPIEINIGGGKKEKWRMDSDGIVDEYSSFFDTED